MRKVEDSSTAKETEESTLTTDRSVGDDDQDSDADFEVGCILILVRYFLLFKICIHTRHFCHSFASNRTLGI